MYAEAAIAILLNQIASEANLAIVPDRRDQSTPTNKTVVTYQQVSSDGNSSLAGSSHQDKVRVQIDLSGPRKSDVLIASKKIRDHIDGYRGQLDGQEYGPIFVCGIEYSSGRSTYSPPSDGSQAGDYTHAVDYMIDLTEGFT